MYRVRDQKHASRPADRLEIGDDVHLSLHGAKAACFQNPGEKARTLSWRCFRFSPFNSHNHINRTGA
jgi:hypothetical protein